VDPVSVDRGRRTQGPVTETEVRVTETEVRVDTDCSDEFPSCQLSVIKNNISASVIKNNISGRAP
jgi:hypothetical protein